MGSVGHRPGGTGNSRVETPVSSCEPPFWGLSRARGFGRAKLRTGRTETAFVRAWACVAAALELVQTVLRVAFAAMGSGLKGGLH